ncbi:MAG TPA: hypothetical protein VFZ09_32085 [Archangium sp.]|uniref:hypothetical protein n=1 Tax=Archangium sp. TaxID=1872627 RepID=UPI002E32109C|nr:hypothetical protein [Archangium sp.]HEX5750909.1 hypothetical protein [Archangium sp.]
MDEESIVLAVVFLLGLGLLAAGVGNLWWSRARLARLRGTPRSRVMEARPGTTVKVVGRLGARKPVRAPLADVDCAYYQLRVDERDGENSSTLFHETEYAEGWELEDEFGRIGLEPGGASLVGMKVREYTPGSLFNGYEVPSHVLSRYVYTETGRGDVGAGTRLREERLEVGASVVVMGQVALGERGPVLVGGERLEVFQGTEREVLGQKDFQLIAWLMVVGGVLLCLAGGAAMFEEPEPVPVVKDEPLRPVAPVRAGERRE